MDNILIAITGKTNDNLERRGKGYIIKYELASALDFDRPAFVRLLFVSGGGRACYVTASFAEEQDFFGNKIPVIGISTIKSPWIALKSGHIPKVGSLFVAAVDGITIFSRDKILHVYFQVSTDKYIEKYAG